MGAREILIAEGVGAVTADRILDQYARELAAAIRFEASHDSCGFDPGWEWAADLIDPDEEA